MRRLWTTFRLGIAALALALVSGAASAHCDFLTGGGFVIRDSGAKANFGIHGGCKESGPDAPFWGHVNYVDHGFSPPGHFSSLTITAYLARFADSGAEKDPKRTGTREICGTGVIKQPGFALVDFRVEATDRGEPGVNDVFKIRLCQGGMVIYSTYEDRDTRLGAGGPGGGNIQLHKPNPSTTGTFGGTCNCPSNR